MSFGRIGPAKKIQEYLNEENLHSYSIEDWRELLSNAFRGAFSTRLYKVNFHYLYRARKNIEVKGTVKPFSSISELWAPPKSKVKSLGRCNLKKQSVLYTSTSPETALFEASLKNGQHVTVLDIESLDEIPYLGIIGCKDIMNTREDLYTIFRGHLRERSEDCVFLDDWLSRIFRQSQPNDLNAPSFYNLTNAISRMFLNNQKVKGVPLHLISPRAIGFIYPSVRTSCEIGVNLVLNPKSMKGYLKPHKVREYVVLPNSRPDVLKVKMVSESEGIDKNGKIKWKKVFDAKELFVPATKTIKIN